MMGLIPKRKRLSKRILVSLTPEDKEKLSKYCRHFGIPMSFFLRYEGLRAIYCFDQQQANKNK